MFRRININIILLIILGFQIFFIVKTVSEEKDRLEEMGKSVIKSATMTQVEKTEENTKLFTESELSEEYDKKTMYRLDLEIENTFSEPVELDFDFAYIQVKSSEDYYFSSEKDWYYADIDEYERPFCEMLPPGETATVSYYVLLYTTDFTELRVYPWSGRDEYVVVENMP